MEGEISEYEKLRMQKLKRNSQVLSDLGLDQQQQPPAIEQDNTPSKTLKRVKASAVTPAVTRRSTRSSAQRTKERLVELDDPYSWRAREAPQDEDEVQIVSQEEGEYAPLVGLNKNHQFDTMLSKGEGGELDGDPLLKKIYSLAFSPSQPGLLAAGGHGGRVALFSTTARETVLSFQATKSWISSVRFTNNSLLLVSSNDGKVSAFDYSLVSAKQGHPKQVSVTSALHGGKGIFDMDVLASPHNNNATSTLATCSKDGSISQSIIAPSGEITLVRQIPRAHSGVCKSIQFQHNKHEDGNADGQIVASGGNDARVLVWDFRVASNEPQIEFKSAFPLAVNGVQWRPASDYQILSSSFAPTMELFDLRSAGGGGRPALVQYTGHSATTNRLQAIYQPVFVGANRILASAGGATALTSFNVDTGVILSRDEVGWEANATTTTTTGGAHPAPLVAISHGAKVSLFNPAQ